MSEQNLGRCKRCKTELEAGDLRCPVCLLKTPDAVYKAAEGRVEVLRCARCKAAFKTEALGSERRCSFCGGTLGQVQAKGPVRASKSADSAIMMSPPERYLPFEVSPQQALERLRAWRESWGWMAPGGLLEDVKRAELKPVWWLIWRSSAEVELSWMADSNANRQRAKWAPEAGNVVMPTDAVFVPASRGLSQSEQTRLRKKYRMDEAQAEPDGPAGALVECADLQRTAIKEKVLKALKQKAERFLKDDILGGARTRKLKYSPLLRKLNSERLALPVYVYHFDYGGDRQRVLINGQDSEQLLGKEPFSTVKMLFFVSAIFLLLTGLLALPFFI